jgi:hypothetical protein
VQSSRHHQRRQYAFRRSPKRLPAGFATGPLPQIHSMVYSRLR